MTKKHEHIGVVEVKKVIAQIDEQTAGQVDRLFILDIDVQSKKVCATYGPFPNIAQLQEFAAIHSLKVTWGI